MDAKTQKALELATKAKEDADHLSAGTFRESAIYQLASMVRDLAQAVELLVEHGGSLRSTKERKTD